MAVAVAGAALVAGMGLTACDPGRPCDQWMTTYHLHSTTVGKAHVMHMDPVQTCVHYAPETQKS
jgi:hypothetical protein